MNPNLFAIHHLYAGSSIEDAVQCPTAVSACWLEYLRVMEKNAKPSTYLERRRAVYARRKLAEWGVLIKYKHKGQKLVGNYDPTYDDTNYQYVWVNYSYTTRPHADSLEYMKREKNKVSHLKTGWHFADGERRVFKIRELTRIDFETQFGRTYVIQYETDDGLLLKYKGSTPPDPGDSAWLTVKASVKHDEFRSEKETRLQRIKIFESHE